MKINFEKYLASQRKHIDIENPDDFLIWEGIHNNLNQRKTRVHNVFWKAAAIILFLVSATYIMYNEFYHNTPGVYNITLSEIEPAYAERVMEYRIAIDEKWTQVQAVKHGEMKRVEVFLTELDGLDKMYREYQEDYRSYGYNEQLVRAMLDYYDKRVRILDRMLMEIQKHKDYEKRKEVETEI